MKLPEQSDFQPFSVNDKVTIFFELSAGFPSKKRSETRAITNSRQLQNNWSLSVWQEQDIFMRSVIT